MSWLRKLARRQLPSKKVHSKPPWAIDPKMLKDGYGSFVIASIREEPAPAGATCTMPEFEVARKKTNGPIDPKTVPVCGKPASITVHNTFQNGFPRSEHYCSRHRPRRSPEVSRAYGLPNDAFRCTQCGVWIEDSTEDCPAGTAKMRMHERPEEPSPAA